MSGTLLRWRAWLWWLLPFAAFLVVLGVETDWGRRLHQIPDPEPALEPKAVSAALLPEYQIEGGIAAHAETVSRTLFNPTRRPSPVVIADGQRKQMQKGQFVLTGTTIAGTRSIAFVREIAGNKSRVVKQGDQLNGMLVAEVKPDRVRLTLGDEVEEIVLKTQVGPHTTVAPPPPSPVAGQPGATPMPGQPDPGVANAATLEERRRAARGAQPPAGAAPTPSSEEGVPVPSPTATPAVAPAGAAPGTAGAGAPPTDPAWAEVYRRMQRNQK
jgi:hypothetical protein